MPTTEEPCSYCQSTLPAKGCPYQACPYRMPSPTTPVDPDDERAEAWLGRIMRSQAPTPVPPGPRLLVAQGTAVVGWGNVPLPPEPTPACDASCERCHPESATPVDFDADVETTNLRVRVDPDLLADQIRVVTWLAAHKLNDAGVVDPLLTGEDLEALEGVAGLLRLLRASLGKGGAR